MPLSKAIWSAPIESETGPGKKVLYGEMRLPENLRPGFMFADFEVKVRDCDAFKRFWGFINFDFKYFIEAYAPSIPGFKPANKHRLFQTEVQICSMHYGGPRPKSYLR